MKKRGLCILTAAVVAWSSIYSFAHADTENVFNGETDSIDNSNNSTENSISITYDSPAPSNRYFVKIEWGNMEFHYKPANKVWNTKTLKWEDAAASAKGTWTDNNGTEIADGIPKIDVSLENYSSSAIKAHFWAESKEFTYQVATLENGTNLQLLEKDTTGAVVQKAQANVDPDKEGTPTTAHFMIAIGGEPNVPIDGGDGGVSKIPVTCTIEPYE
ncbi:MAG: hypothetical protein IJ733_12770 [Lachnospiraceae bacterium]|nr:hypothetical protein [Lachnospiraceae bacterium]